MEEEKEKPIIIELYELWNTIKARFSIVAPQPKSFNLRKEVIPTFSLNAFSIEHIDLSSNASVAGSGGVQDQLIQPPYGYVYQVIDIVIKSVFPAGAGSGTHQTQIFSMGLTSTESKKVTVVSTFNSTGYMGLDYAFTGDSAETPSGSDEQMMCITQVLWATHDKPLTVRYQNDTNVASTSARTMLFTVKKYGEGA